MVIAALALSDCGTEAGCLSVIPGSHRWEVLPHREHFGTASLLTREQRIDAPLDESAAVSLPMAAGEVVLFKQCDLPLLGPEHERRPAHRLPHRVCAHPRLAA